MNDLIKAFQITHDMGLFYVLLKFKLVMIFFNRYSNELFSGKIDKENLKDFL